MWKNVKLLISAWLNLIKDTDILRTFYLTNQFIVFFIFGLLPGILLKCIFPFITSGVKYHNKELISKIFEYEKLDMLQRVFLYKVWPSHEKKIPHCRVCRLNFPAASIWTSKNDLLRCILCDMLHKFRWNFLYREVQWRNFSTINHKCKISMKFYVHKYTLKKF